MRKERTSEQVLLKQLKEEYTTNIKQLDIKIATRNVIIESSKKMLNFYDKPESATLNDLLNGISNLGLTVTYDPINNDLVGSGNINRISHPKLKTLLTSWSTDVIQVQEVERIYLNRFHDHINPFLVSLGVSRALDERFWKSIQELDFMLSQDEVTSSNYGSSRFMPSKKELLDNVKLEGHISNSIMINEFINLESYTLRNQIVQILDLLDKEIK